MASEALLNTTESKQASSVEDSASEDVKRIKELIAASPKTLDNYDIAEKLGLDPDYVEKLCMDIYDAMIVEERQGDKYITLEGFDEWLKENDLV